MTHRSAAYSVHLADWDQVAITEREAALEAARRAAETRATEPEDDPDLLLDPCPSFAGLSADLGPPPALHSNATEALGRIAATLPDLSGQFDAALEDILSVTRDMIAEVYARSFQTGLPTILDTHLASLLVNLRKTTTDSVRVEVRMTTDDLPALERRLARHRNDNVSLVMIPSTAPGHCTATLAWSGGTIAFDAGILARGIAEIFADPAVLPAPPRAMRAASHWDPH